MTVEREPWWQRVATLEVRVALLVVLLLRFIGAQPWGLGLGMATIAAAALARRWGTRTHLHVAVAAGVAATLLVAPFVTSSSFRVNQLSLALVTVLALLGLNLIIGVGGLMALAHVAFMGAGAYTAAIVAGRWERTIYEGVVAAAAVAAAVGLLLALPTLKLVGHHLAIATLGVAIIFGPLMKLDLVSDYTGGVQGLSYFATRYAPPVDASWLTDDRWYYFLCLVAVGVGLLVFRNIATAPLGRALRAARDNRLAALAMGVDLRRERILLFVASAAFAGVAGALQFVVSNRFVAPDSFNLIVMIELLVAGIIGGIATARGALLGGLFLVFVYRDLVSSLSRDVTSGEHLGLAVVVTLIALLGTRRVMAAPGWLGAARSRPWALPAYRGAIALLTGAAVYALWSAVGHKFEALAITNLLTGALLIVTVLCLPEGLAGLFRPGPAAVAETAETPALTRPAPRLGGPAPERRALDVPLGSGGQ